MTKHKIVNIWSESFIWLILSLHVKFKNSYKRFDYIFKKYYQDIKALKND